MIDYEQISATPSAPPTPTTRSPMNPEAPPVKLTDLDKMILRAEAVCKATPRITCRRKVVDGKPRWVVLVRAGKVPYQGIGETINAAMASVAAEVARHFAATFGDGLS